MNAATLLALDWGTSSLRAFLMCAGEVVESRHSEHGIQHLPAPGVEGYEQALAQIAGDWIRRWPGLPAVACGMVGSAQGWSEAAYLRCPASLQSLAGHGVRVRSRTGLEILIAPGLLCDEPGAAPDVMRGEEVQIAGALRLAPRHAARGCFVLPGTHSKWAEVEDGRVLRFATCLTGEVYALLRRHSILARSLPDAAAAATEPDAEAFAGGLDAARRAGPGDWLHQLFAVRTLALTGRMAAPALADHLSGLLIGHEIVSRLRGTAPVVLVGEPALCRRYALALRAFGVVDCELLDNSAPAGLWALAAEASLIPPTP